MSEQPDARRRPVISQLANPVSFAEIMGRLFELGFNTGFLALLSQRTDVSWFASDLFAEDLASVYLPALIAAAQAQTHVRSPWDLDMIRDWVQYVVLEGYLAGSNFLAEFVATLRQGDEKWQGMIPYLQCTFSGKNTLGTVPSPSNLLTAANRLLAQFARAKLSPITLSMNEVERYSEPGAFLNADLLLLLHEPHGWRVLCVDLSIFGLLELRDTHDLHRAASLRKILRRNLRYLRSRSVFTNLSIDTNDDTTAQKLLHDDIARYFTAFAREDKETMKFIQAASYTGSFYDFLLQKGLVSPTDPIVFHVVGYTDRAMNAMALKPAQLSLLRTCQTIYRSKPTDVQIAQAREDVIGAIERAANRSFQGDEPFATQLLALAEQGDGLHLFTYEENLTGFLSTLSPLTQDHLPAHMPALLPADYEGKPLRGVHRDLVCRELASSDRYLFLTGHPGIGKTSALAAFLSEAAVDKKGFVLLYASPRSQVNLDIFKTFQEAECANLWGMTTSASIIRRHQGRPAVEYLSSLCEGEFRHHGILFAPLQSEEDAPVHALSRLKELQANVLIDRSKQTSGVLKSLCEALGLVLTEQFPAAHPNQIAQPQPLSVVATVAIQSLKRTPHGKNTLRHLKAILGSVLAQDKVIPHKMQQLAQRFRYFFVMIDEITGDEGGAEFLEGIHRFFQEYEFEKYGIVPKIIVADASIVDPGVIQAHLATQEFEPQKIYFRHVSSTSANVPLLFERLTKGFKRCPAVVINANAYPASNLRITYKVLTNSFPYDEDRYQEQDKVLRSQQQDMLLRDIAHFMDTDPESQLIVYIQDKKRLDVLIRELARQRPFKRGQEYLDIHANLSEKQKHDIQETQNTVPVIFMTASASRGLSFKRARHILVDIPHFALEQNLMEILQVIYRGRGGALDLAEKTLTFYLADQLLYLDEEDRILARKEQLLHILNVFLILKTAITTRIFGGGQLGRRSFRMIPIGGKSLSTASATFSNRLSDLLDELNKTRYPNWADRPMVTFIADGLHTLLSQSELNLIRQEMSGLPYRNQPRSYLENIAVFAGEFTQEASRGFQHILKLPVFESAYLTGGLLTVPISGRSLQELYRASLLEVLRRPRPEKLPDLLSCMEIISGNPLYPMSLRTALGDAVVLLRAFQQLNPDKSAYYEQESLQSDSYYAFPLFSFQTLDSLREHFARRGEEQEDVPFQDLLRRLIQSCYPADSFLPIGKNYKVFPFVLFRSFQLGETRQKIFTEKYLFSSQEFNILNMLLSGKE